MTDIIGAISAEALAADVRSAPSRKPRFDAFHCIVASCDSKESFLTEGRWICGLGRLTVAGEPGIDFGESSFGLDPRYGMMEGGGEDPERRTLKPS